MQTSALIKRGIANYVLKRPFCISFEVTYSCNAKCKHCHLRGHVANEKRIAPEKFGELCKEFKPIVAQVSGGEPLLRKDLEQIIKALKEPNRIPYVVLTTNAALLTKEKYYRLLQAGVNEFSISLDYPDKRHDEFRGIPGLFERIKKLIQDIDQEKNKFITLACVIQKDNFRELPRMAKLAKSWRVNINFSTYTWMRTNNKNFMLSQDDVEELKKILCQLCKFKKQHGTIFTSKYVFGKMVEYFKNNGIPNCRAGERFFIISPDGTFSPCGLILKHYNSKEQMKKDFVKKNTCETCYTSIRANPEKPIWHLIKDNIGRRK